MICCQRFVLAISSFPDFKADKSRHFVAVATDVFDFDAFSQFSGDSTKSFVCLIFWKGRAAPLEELNQCAPQVFVFFTSTLSIRIKASKELGKTFRRERGCHSTFTLQVGPFARLYETGPVIWMAVRLILK